MKAALIIVSLFAVGLCVATVQLFGKVNTLELQFLELKRELHDEAAVRTQQGTELNEALKGSLTRVEKHVGDTAQKLEAACGQIKASQEMLESEGKALAALKEDIAQGVRAAVVQSVLDAAVTSAVHEVVQGGTFLNDEKVYRAVATVLAKDHKAELRGTPGLNADNEVVASMLKKDQEFLDRIRVFVLAGQSAPVKQP